MERALKTQKKTHIRALWSRSQRQSRCRRQKNIKSDSFIRRRLQHCFCLPPNRSGAIHLIKCNCWERTCSERGKKRGLSSSLMPICTKAVRELHQRKQKGSCVSRPTAHESSSAPFWYLQKVLVPKWKCALCSSFVAWAPSLGTLAVPHQEKFIIEENLLSHSFLLGVAYSNYSSEGRLCFCLSLWRRASDEHTEGTDRESILFDLQCCQTNLDFIFLEVSQIKR